MKPKDVLYMVVTADKYELPIYVCDSVSEVASLLKIKNESVSSRITRNFGKRYKILRVKKC